MIFITEELMIWSVVCVNTTTAKKYTSKVDDWKLVYYEAYAAESDAKDREEKLKGYGAAYGHLKNRIEDSIDKVT